MGFIYIIHGPKNKKYIGQTKHSIQKRYHRHCNSVLNEKPKCTCLYRAMKKYGINNFKCEKLIEIDNELLDEYEKRYIKEYNTIAPNGYNLESGGTNKKNVNIHTREKISKFYKTNDLPMYINIRNYKNYYRYRVQNHPMGKDKTFKTFQEAKDHIDFLNTLNNPIKTTKFTTIKYIQKYKNGYCVDIPNIKCKYFIHKEKDNYKRAFEYLNQNLQHDQIAGNSLEL